MKKQGRNSIRYFLKKKVSILEARSWNSGVESNQFFNHAFQLKATP